MMKKTALYISIFSILLMASCYRSDVRELTITIPQLNGPACAERVRSELEGIKGVDRVAIDMDAKQAVVTYDRLNMSDRNIELVLTAAGFDANASIADPGARAKLPPPCR